MHPASGPDVGGTRVVVGGSALDQATLLLDGQPVAATPCAGPQVSSHDPVPRVPSLICFTSPPHAPGDVTLVARAPDGALSSGVTFRYVATPAPVIRDTRGLTPSSGPDAGGTAVKVVGENFDQGTVYIDDTAVATQPCGGTHALCYTSPPHAPGAALVTVHTPDGKLSNAVPFRYVATPPPSLGAISPDHGPDVGGTRVVLTGAHLHQGVVFVDGAPATMQACSALFAIDRLCFFTPPHAPGDAVVQVRTPDGKTSDTLTFHYAATPPPRIQSLLPDLGSTRGGTHVIVRGGELDQGVVFVDDVAAATRECGTDRGGGVMLCFTTPPHAAGVAHVTVRTPDGKSSPAVDFRYTDGPR